MARNVSCFCGGARAGRCGRSRGPPLNRHQQCTAATQLVSAYWRYCTSPLGPVPGQGGPCVLVSAPGTEGTRAGSGDTPRMGWARARGRCDSSAGSHRALAPWPLSHFEQCRGSLRVLVSAAVSDAPRAVAGRFTPSAHASGLRRQSCHTVPQNTMCQTLPQCLLSEPQATGY